MKEQLCWKLTHTGAICNVYEAVIYGEEATVALRVTAYRSIKKIDLDADITNLKIADHKQMRIMFPVSHGICVKCDDSVMSCPITILIRKAPQITLW